MTHRHARTSEPPAKSRTSGAPGNTISHVLGRDAIHPFPARMAPEVALAAIPEGSKPLRILDPMMGSGTVIALARKRGHRAVGLDIDPLAVLISSVWTTPIGRRQVVQMANRVLLEARRIFSKTKTKNAYPRNADRETRKFVAYWFDGYSRRQLASLASTISRVNDDTIRNALWCGFSRLIITKQSGSSLAMDLSHSRPHRAFERAPVKPLNKFLQMVKRVVDNCIESTTRSRGPAPQLSIGDARKLPISDGSIDVVLTSPPYLNAIDYIRCSKFTLVWMGYGISELRKLRASSIGSESRGPTPLDRQEFEDIIVRMKLRGRLRPRENGILKRYLYDMLLSLREASRVLRVTGRAVYVVGENTLRGNYIPNSIAISEIAQLCGLNLRSRLVRTLPADRRYLPPPALVFKRTAFGARMRREVVLCFDKRKSLAS